MGTKEQERPAESWGEYMLSTQTYKCSFLTDEQRVEQPVTPRGRKMRIDNNISLQEVRAIVSKDTWF